MGLSVLWSMAKGISGSRPTKLRLSGRKHDQVSRYHHRTSKLSHGSENHGRNLMRIYMPKGKDHPLRNMLRRILAKDEFAWPGGYQCYVLFSDGEPLCFQCARENIRQITRETLANPFPHGWWKIEGIEVHWEGAPLFCCNCFKEIPSAYGEES